MGEAHSSCDRILFYQLDIRKHAKQIMENIKNDRRDSLVAERNLKEINVIFDALAACWEIKTTDQKMRPVLEDHRRLLETEEKKEAQRTAAKLKSGLTKPAPKPPTATPTREKRPPARSVQGGGAAKVINLDSTAKSTMAVLASLIPRAFPEASHESEHDETRSELIDDPLLRSVQENPRRMMDLSNDQHWALWTSAPGLELFYRLTLADTLEYERELEHAIKVMRELFQRQQGAEQTPEQSKTTE